MEVEPFELTVPQVTSNIGQVPSLASHTANLVGNYMIVAFGKLNLHCFMKKNLKFFNLL